MIDLSGKVAIVTGGASGIGAATAALLAELGATVVIGDIQEEKANDVAAGIQDAGGRAHAVTTDIREEDQWERLVATTLQEFGKLDILHNNAADLDIIANDPQVTEQDLGTWELSLRADITGAMLGCKHGVRAMLETGGGSIINTASVSGVGAEVYMTAYPVAKAAVIHLSRSVALQYGKQGIRCNAICPGLVLSPAGLGMAEEMRNMYVRHNMVPFVAEPKDIAPLVAFLACDQARYLTGESICIDGGITNMIPIAADVRDFLAGGDEAPLS